MNESELLIKLRRIYQPKTSLEPNCSGRRPATPKAIRRVIHGPTLTEGLDDYPPTEADVKEKYEDE